MKLHYHDIDLLIREALHASSPDGRLDIDQDPQLGSWMKWNGIELPVMSMVNNYDGKEWVTTQMAEMLAKLRARERLSNSLAFCHVAASSGDAWLISKGCRRPASRISAVHSRPGDRDA